MSENRASKEWSPFSKQIKMGENDWAVVDALYEDYRNREGVISKADFLGRLLITGVSTQLVRLRQHSPESIAKIARSSGAKLPENR